MHEFAIAESIVKIVKENLSEKGISQKVISVTVEAGRMNAIIPDSLEFHFDVLKKTVTGLEAAALNLVSRPVRAECTLCHATEELEEPDVVCSKCGGFLNILSGRELFVTAIEVEDEP